MLEFKNSATIYISQFNSIFSQTESVCKKIKNLSRTTSKGGGCVCCEDQLQLSKTHSSAIQKILIVYCHDAFRCPFMGSSNCPHLSPPYSGAGGG